MGKEMSQLNQLKAIRGLSKKDKAYKEKVIKEAPVLKDVINAPNDLSLEFKFLPEKVLQLMVVLSKYEDSQNRPKIIETAKSILDLIDTEEFPEFAATMYMEIGGAFAASSNGDTNHLMSAIDYSKLAIEHITIEDFPMETYKICLNIIKASSVEELYDWDNSDELRKNMIGYGQLALKVKSEFKLNVDLDYQIIITENIATAYLGYTEGDINENRDNAIKYFELTILEYEKFPSNVRKSNIAYSYGQLAGLYHERKNGEKAENEIKAEKYLNKYYECSKK